MEDVMETCWLDSVTMCSRGYKCETCPKNLEFEKSAEKAFKLEKMERILQICPRNSNI